MAEDTRRKNEGKTITPSDPKAPAQASDPSDPPAPRSPGRSAGGHAPEVQTPLADPEKHTGDRQAPSTGENQPGERLAEGSDVGKFLDEPSDYPIPRGAPEQER